MPHSSETYAKTRALPEDVELPLLASAHTSSATTRPPPPCVLPMPAVNQIELHPWSQKPELVRYLEAHAITPVAYSSLVPLSTWRSAAGQGSAKTDQMKADGEQADAPFKVMAKKYGVTEAQVLLRWGVQKGYPVLPKSTSPDRIRKNADIFGFTIDHHDMAAIAKLDRGYGVAWATGDPTRAP